MKLVANAPVADAAFRKSMHKTYTDCYRMQGFTGGDWGFSINTNASEGRALFPTKCERVDKQQRRLAVYYLGWESREV